MKLVIPPLVKKYLKVWIDPYHGLHFHVVGCWMIDYQSYIEMPLELILNAYKSKNKHSPIRTQIKKYMPCTCFELYLKSLPKIMINSLIKKDNETNST